MTFLQALSATFGRGPAARHLVIVAALNPSVDALGPRGTLAWSTAVEQLHQVRKIKAAWNISPHILYPGTDPGAPDRPISVGDGRSNSFVLGPGKFADLGFLNDFN